jgi:hypothetical protein
MKKDKQFKIVNPPTRVKYKKFCKRIRENFHKQYISYVDNNATINLHRLMEILATKLKPKVNDSFARHKKYTIRDYVNGIIEILRNGRYWSRYNGLIKGNTLNKKHNDFCKWGVYECLYRIILCEYFSKNKFSKLHFQSIDSTFIPNLYGTELCGRCKKYGYKKGIKLNFVVESHGVPISIAIAPANRYDNVITKEQLQHEYLIDTGTKHVKNNNRFKQIVTADAAYHDQNLAKIMAKKGFKLYTDVNIRNTKNPEKLKILDAVKKEYKKRQSKRLVSEHCNAWIKQYPKMDKVIEKTIRSFVGLLLLSLSHIVSGKIK